MADANQNRLLKAAPSWPPNFASVSYEEFRAALQARAPEVLTSRRPAASAAVDLATKLIGAWPYGKADDPKTYLASLGAALGEYPMMIAEECADPRTGLARTREMMPTVASIHDWCGNRLDYYRKAARPRLA